MTVERRPGDALGRPLAFQVVHFTLERALASAEAQRSPRRASRLSSPDTSCLAPASPARGQP